MTSCGGAGEAGNLFGKGSEVDAEMLTCFDKLSMP
jgi:hypothetical protein